jgi:hypothetical protein
MSESTHLFAIPTDRPCAESLESYREEVRKLARRKGVHVLVLEDRPLPPEVTTAHRRTVASVTADVGCTGSVITDEEWSHLADKETWPSYAIPLLRGNSLNYGRAFNRVALLARALDAEVVHRRDSDTQMPEEFKAWDTYSVDYELDGLGSGCDVAGGNYWGNWNVAVGPLANDEERLRLMLSAHGIPPVGQESIINQQIPRAAEPPTRNPGGVSHGAYPDLGNCAFRTLPAVAFPAPLHADTIGTDYLFLALAVRWERGWLHSLSVRHKHSGEREEMAYLGDYWLRRARQMDFLLVLRELQGKSANPGEYDRQREILGNDLKRLDDTLDRLEPVRHVYWGAYVEAFRETELDRSVGISNHLREQRLTVQTQNDVAIAEYGSLLLGWEDLSARLIESLQELGIGAGSPSGFAGG